VVFAAAVNVMIAFPLPALAEVMVIQESGVVASQAQRSSVIKLKLAEPPDAGRFRDLGEIA
jgi:hypothetical protein